MQDIVIPPFGADTPLPEIIAQQEEEIKVECPLQRQKVTHVGQSAKQRHHKSNRQIKYRPIKQPFWSIIQQNAPVNQAHQVPQDTVGEVTESRDERIIITNIYPQGCQKLKDQ